MTSEGEQLAGAIVPALANIEDALNTFARRGTELRISEGVAIIEATEPLQFALAGRLFEEYAAELGVDLCFQGFAAELTQLPVMYGPPGCLLLVLRDGEPVGCGALRFWADGICEMKRLYVRANERGGQLGRRVAEALIDRARARGFRTMRLDTLAAMEVAQRMYQSLGFREVASYYDNPLPGTIYLELDLRSPAHIPAGTSVDKSQVGCVMPARRLSVRFTAEAVVARAKWPST